LPVIFQTKIVFRSDFCQYRLSFVFLPIDKITLHVHAAKISLAAMQMLYLWENHLCCCCCC